MKKLALTAALFLGLNMTAQAAKTCTNSDLTGEWGVEYFVSSPVFVGTCTIVLDNNMVPSGKCVNVNDTEETDVFDGIGTISKTCNVKTSMTFNNGLKISTVSKMAADKQYISGSFTSSMKGKITKGKITFHKTGDLSCQVTPRGE
ncbi:MAG: hypothetical protein WBI40_00655 [Methylococcaceae bacterium]